MPTIYTEIPDNYREIEDSVITDIHEIKEIFFRAEKVLFYDACSFQRHSNLAEKEKEILLHYYVNHGVVVFMTRCILMELAGDRHRLLDHYVAFISNMKCEGVKVVLFNEEYTYSILSECFSTIDKVNEYLMWAVRMVKTPVSTIADTFKANERLRFEVYEGKNLKASDLYQRFFSAVRGNKEHEDNLGEELIAVCMHILSYLPGIPDGKLCVMTDDKGAAGKIHSALARTNPKNRGSKVILFSTPKLVQHMFQESVEMSEDEMVNIISQGTSENVVVMGITAYDLEVNKSISMSCRKLVKKIMEPNGIQIVF